MIFRKVSDLKREKELAEKRKNDPALNQSQDHLVRKLFSKFKKTNTNSDMSALVPMRDPERADTSPAISRNNSMSGMFPPKVPEVNENGNSTNSKPPTSSILNVNKSTNKVNSELTTLTETTEKPAKTAVSAAPAAVNTNAAPLTLIKSKPIANGPRGWGRLKAKTNNNTSESANTEKETFPKQEPLKLINDTQSEVAKSVIKDPEPQFSSSTSSDTKDSVESVPTKPKFNIPKLSLSSDTENNIGPGVSSPGQCQPEPGHSGHAAVPMLPLHPPEYTHMISNLMDFKV